MPSIDAESWNTIDDLKKVIEQVQETKEAKLMPLSLQGWMREAVERANGMLNGNGKAVAQ